MSDAVTMSPEPEVPPRSARPRPWIAFALALSSTGLGHFYAGSLAGAAIAAAFWFAGATLVIWIFATPFGSPWPLAAAALLFLFVLLAPAFHARRAARGGTFLIASRWKRVAACAAYLVAVSWLADASLSPWRLRSDSLHVPSVAMYPSLLAGDYIVVDTRQRTLDSLHRGRIVIYRMARDGTTLVPADRASPELRLEKFVKRVVGLAGDAIDVTRDELRINGALVARRALGADVEPTSGRELALYEETLDGAHYSVAEMPGQEFRLFPGTTVEKNRFFVLGDNRDNANDSRYSGTIHRSDLVGVVSHIYFSRDPSTKEIRWERIGRVVR